LVGHAELDYRGQPFGRFFGWPAHYWFCHAEIVVQKIWLQPVEVETYNDIDSRLTRFFRVLRDRDEEFIRRARLTPYSQLEFEAARE